MNHKYLLFFIITGILVPGCEHDNQSIAPVDEFLNAKIIKGFSDNIAYAMYQALDNETDKLHDRIFEFIDNPSESGLDACRATWKTSRMYWEQSEAFLFGPVASENIDPRVDTWPVNFTDLEAQLGSNHEFSEEYINGLEDALKGFHPIEYLLFGETGNKKVSEFTEREFEYLKGLIKNLHALTHKLKTKWDPTDEASYYYQFLNAGQGSDSYPTQRDAFEELVSGMAGICEEVAGGKISEPFLQQEPTLEESPFSNNSIDDFTHNIRGVQNVYLGKFLTDGAGLEDLVRRSNLSLDGEIKLRLNSAISALGKITDPFGEAIFSQPVQIQNAIGAIDELKEILENDLISFVNQHVE